MADFVRGEWPENTCVADSGVDAAPTRLAQGTRDAYDRAARAFDEWLGGTPPTNAALAAGRRFRAGGHDEQTAVVLGLDRKPQDGEQAAGQAGSGVSRSSDRAGRSSRPAAAWARTPAGACRARRCVPATPPRGRGDRRPRVRALAAGGVPRSRCAMQARRLRN